MVKADGTGQRPPIDNALPDTGRYGANSVFAGGGTALVIHAKGDDMKSDPSGNAGDRIACAVVGKKENLHDSRMVSSQPLKMRTNDKDCPLIAHRP